MQKEIELPEVIVFPHNEDTWQFMGEKQTIFGVMQDFRKDVTEGEVREETIGTEYKLFYDGRAYMARDMASCQSFDHSVREHAPYAPIFRGNLVLLSRFKFFLPSFQDKCAALWKDVAPHEDIPDDVKALAERLGLKMEDEISLSQSTSELTIE